MKTNQYLGQLKRKVIKRKDEVFYTGRLPYYHRSRWAKYFRGGNSYLVQEVKVGEVYQIKYYYRLNKVWSGFVHKRSLKKVIDRIKRQGFNILIEQQWKDGKYQMHKYLPEFKGEEE